MERIEAPRMEETSQVISEVRTPIVTKTQNHQTQNSPNSPVPPTGKHSLLQYAMQYFRQNPE